MSHTPPVDSKGAAIRAELYPRLGGNWTQEQEDAAVEAILAILAQEVNKARINELTLINARFSTVRGAPKHKEMIEGYMLARDEFSRVKRERITELERLG